MTRTLFRGLGARLVVLLAIAIVPALAMLAAERLDHRRQETEQRRQTALALARLAAQAQQRRIEAARQLLIALSRSSELDQNPDACTQFVRGLTAEYEGLYTEIGWADAGGRVVCHALDGPPNISIADRAYFQRVMQTKTFAVGELMHGRLSGAPVLAFSYPKRDAKGTMVGVVFANVDLRALSASLGSDVNLPEATVSVVDRTGSVLARSKDGPKFIGSRASAEHVAMMTARKEFAGDFVALDGVRRTYGVVSVRDKAGSPMLFVAVGLARDALDAAVNRRLRFDLLVVSALGAGLLCVAWITSGRLIRRPVNRLLDATSALAAGQLEARATAVGGSYELRALGKAFNEMAERLQQRDVHLRRSQRLEAVGQLAGGIAHDFNNLLTVIVGYAHSLQAYLPAHSPARRELSELLSAAEKAAKLTHQLLAFSRRQVLQPKPVNLNEIVSQTQALLTRTIGDDITLVRIIPSDLSVVRADASQLEQVLLNLVINARDAMPTGGTVTIETANVHVESGGLQLPSEDFTIPAGDYVTLSVTDTGLGMDPDTRAHIFEPFFTTKGKHGTGLGLATVYGIVKQSGGFISCASELGSGSRFVMYLPRTSDTLDVSGEQAPAPPPGGTESIIVVEDESAVRSMLATVLTRAGYRIRSAHEASEAATWITNGEPVDLIVTDVKMPGMTGQALYEHGRRVRPDLPVLFISGYASDALKQQSCIPEGASFLQKPFAPYELLRKVRQALDESRSAWLSPSEPSIASGDRSGAASIELR